MKGTLSTNYSCGPERLQEDQQYRMHTTTGEGPLHLLIPLILHRFVPGGVIRTVQEAVMASVCWGDGRWRPIIDDNLSPGSAVGCSSSD